MLEILYQIFPKPNVILVITPLTIFCIFLFLYCSGALKISYKVKTNYTRKLFHILVFTLAGLIGYLFDFKAVMLYGGITGLIVIYILCLGDGNLLFEGIAREQDEPHRRFYIGVPFIATALAGILNNSFFGQFALIGYLVAGWGDAIGEPVGVRFGKHKYDVPSLLGVSCKRSIEGSLAIMCMSIIATIVALVVIGFNNWSLLVLIALMSGLVTALVEAFSPHGIDNLTTQVMAVAVCFGLVSLI